MQGEWRQAIRVLEAFPRLGQLQAMRPRGKRLGKELRLGMTTGAGRQDNHSTGPYRRNKPPNPEYKATTSGSIATRIAPKTSPSMSREK
jgi:hypothetical protein